MNFTRAACWINSSNREKKQHTHNILILYNYWKSLKFDSHHQKTWLYLLQWKPFKNDEKYCIFHHKTLLVLKIFKFLCLLFGHVKNVLIRKVNFERLISKCMTSQLVNKQLHYTYCSLSHKVTRQWNLTR